MRDLGSTDGRSIIQHEWDWPVVPPHKKHSERVTLLRPIPFEMTVPGLEVGGRAHHGRALSVNISSGGMLLLMDQAPTLEQVMKVPFPASSDQGAYFVGLKFLF